MAPLILTEDDIYRSSTQYRLWSFTPETLASLRETNRKAALDQASGGGDVDNEKSSGEDGGRAQDGAASSSSGETITSSDEHSLLTHHTHKLLRLALTHLSLPTPVAATGAVYLKRFYLSHSPITDPPQSIMATCLFLATKTEHYYVPLSTFVKKWKPELQTEDVLRHEGTVTQALRFSFDVKHPFRGLRGALMELRAMADGKVPPSSNTRWNSAHDMQQEMLSLPPPAPKIQHAGNHSGASETKDQAPMSVRQAQDRAFQAHDRAKDLLASSALLTDACFLYTPAQMMFAALLLADEPLALFYLATKLPTRSAAPAALANGADKSASDGNARDAHDADAFGNKLMATVRACAELIAAAPEPLDRDAVANIERKVEQHRRTHGAVEAQRGSKRHEADASSGGEKSAKKRKLHSDAETSPFGGPLVVDAVDAKAAKNKPET